MPFQMFNIAVSEFPTSWGVAYAPDFQEGLRVGAAVDESWLIVGTNFGDGTPNTPLTLMNLIGGHLARVGAGLGGASLVKFMLQARPWTPGLSSTVSIGLTLDIQPVAPYPPVSTPNQRKWWGPNSRIPNTQHMITDGVQWYELVIPIGAWMAVEQSPNWRRYPLLPPSDPRNFPFPVLIINGEIEILDLVICATPNDSNYNWM